MDNTNPNPEGRSFADLKDRLNDREPRTPQEEEMSEQDLLDNYPREAINDEIMDKDQIDAVQQRMTTKARLEA